MNTRTLTTKKGKTIETNLSDGEALAILEELRDDGKLSNFGVDLLQKDRRYGLSHDQMVWVHVLAVEASVPVVRDVVEYMHETPVLLAKAREAGLKHPKIRLVGENGQKVVLSLAGDRAKFPGSVNVTDGGPFGEGVWFGRIHKDGRYEPSRSNTYEVQTVVSLFNANPALQGKLQGALTGSCCFCGRHLETKESVGVGYGPVCAEKYGLPWGETESYEAKKETVVEELVEPGDDWAESRLEAIDRQLQEEEELVAIEMGQFKLQPKARDDRLDSLVDELGF